MRSVSAAHVPGLAGARILQTDAFRLTAMAVRHVLEINGLGLVYGDAGNGKTFAVRAALTSAHSESVLPAWIDITPEPTLKSVTRQMLSAVTGMRHDGDRYQLTDTLIDVLSEGPTVLVLDEAQRLSREAIEQVRHLHDQPGTHFAVILVGGHGCWNVISRYPMLQSRIQRIVRFSPLTDREVLEFIPSFHPVYEDVDPEVLMEIDRRFAHGRLRDWAKFTQVMVQLKHEGYVETVDVDALDLAFVLINGEPGVRHAS